MAERITLAIHVVLGLLAILGHLALWTGAFSRVHGLLPRRWQVELVEKPILLALLGLPATVLLQWISDPPVPFDLGHAIPGGLAGWMYFGLCCAWGAGTSLAWGARKLRGSPPHYLRCEREVVLVTDQLGRLPYGDRLARLLGSAPGNQVLELETNVKTVLLPRLPPCLDGLSIVHLSDLHFTGRLTSDFFHFVVDRANALEGDLVALTGDVIDNRECLNWVPEILGRIERRMGAFCIFGNHDLRIRNMSLLATEFEQAGWHYLGGRWLELRVRGHSLVLAGNELPWLAPPADMSTCRPPADGRRAVRILLSHSPDQIQWARARDFDLMLAGHTHGGQIQFPVIGPVIGQSRYGVRYCCGVFYEPPTLLHVSRGLSGLQNLRINCRPELTKLVLKSGTPLTVDGKEQAAVSRLPGLPVPAAVSRS